MTRGVTSSGGHDATPSSYPVAGEALHRADDGAVEDVRHHAAILLLALVLRGVEGSDRWWEGNDDRHSGTVVGTAP